MKSFSGLGIGLSLVFGCLVLALVAELYYLLWWKKRFADSQVEHDDTSQAQELVQLFCWKKPSASLHAPNIAISNSNQGINGVEPDLELGSTKGLLLMGFGEDGVESELMRLHNLAGPPRFLFTIKEETKEDLESEDKGSRRRNLNDVMLPVDTPNFHSPLSSPPLKSPLGSYYRPQEFNPLFESSTDAELNKLRSSPPPKFKFLRDAEEKLLRRLTLESDRSLQRNGGSFQDSGTEGTIVEGSFLKFIVGKNMGSIQYLQQYPSSSSQVLPLSSSPTTFRPPDKKDNLH